MAPQTDAGVITCCGETKTASSSCLLAFLLNAGPEQTAGGADPNITPDYLLAPVLV